MPTTLLDGVNGRSAPVFGAQPPLLARAAVNASSPRLAVSGRVVTPDDASVAMCGRCPFILQALSAGSLPL